MRKHKEVIMAWLDGKDIQYKIVANDPWITIPDSMAINPITYQDLEWRIKPEAKTITIPIFSNASNVAAYFNRETREIVIEYKEEAL